MFSEKCNAGEFMSMEGCQKCPGVSYSLKGAYGAEQCDSTNKDKISCRPIKIKKGTLSCSETSPVTCTFTCPTDTFIKLPGSALESEFTFTCNPATKKWSHQTEKNRFGRVPRCAPVVPPPDLKMPVSVQFVGSECPTDAQSDTGVKSYFSTSTDSNYNCFDEGNADVCKITRVS